MADEDEQDLSAELADLNAEPVAVPEERMRAAVKALGLPEGSSAAIVNSHDVPMLLTVTDAGDSYKVGGVVNMPRKAAIALLRAIADEWDLREMGVASSDD